MSELKKLYIVGAGGFGREVLWLVHRINASVLTWDVVGFIDDNKELHGKTQDNYPILGGCNYLAELNEEVWVICSIASAKAKKNVIDRISKIDNVKYAMLIDPSVIMSERVVIGNGTIICAGTIITVDIQIGAHVILNLDCTVGHDAIVEDYVTIYPSVNISGNTIIGESSELGTGCQIIQGKKVGRQSIIGAGAVVVRDIPDKCTAVGIPAKPIKFFE